MFFFSNFEAIREKTQAKITKAISDYNHPFYCSNTANNLYKILEQSSKQDILEAIKQLPKDEILYSLAQALNKETLLGKRFWKQEGLHKCSIEKGTLKKIKDLYQSLTAERIEVRRAARIISQGIRDQSASTNFKFFKNMPQELALMIAVSVADTLSPKRALKIVNDNFNRPSLTKDACS